MHHLVSTGCDLASSSDEDAALPGPPTSMILRDRAWPPERCGDSVLPIRIIILRRKGL